MFVHVDLYYLTYLFSLNNEYQDHLPVSVSEWRQLTVTLYATFRMLAWTTPVMY